MAVSGRIVAFLAALGAVAAGGYWYWSPYLEIRSMQAAAKAGDADAFNRRVDYPRLRESLKGQFGALMAERMSAAETGGSDAARAGTALGMALGGALMDRMVDSMVRPETVMRGMARGQLQAARPGAGDPAGEAKRVDWAIKRDGMDRVTAFARSPGEPTSGREQGAGFVFERSGFATWRLSEVRLPVTR
jgi:hypothetical protein